MVPHTRRTADPISRPRRDAITVVICAAHLTPGGRYSVRRYVVAGGVAPEVLYLNSRGSWGSGGQRGGSSSIPTDRRPLLVPGTDRAARRRSEPAQAAQVAVDAEPAVLSELGSQGLRRTRAPAQGSSSLWSSVLHVALGKMLGCDIATDRATFRGVT